MTKGKKPVGVMQLDFRSAWPEIIPLLSEPLLVEALDEGLADYDRLYPAGALHRDRSKPWTYTIGDLWEMRADKALKASGLLISPDCLGDAYEVEDGPNAEEEAEAAYLSYYDALAAQFYPRPDTPEWYMAFGLSHWLAEWQACIGQMLIPVLDWKPVYGCQHSTAVGFAPKSKFTVPVVVFDLLREHQDPAETLREVWRRKPLPGKSVPRISGPKPGLVTWAKLVLVTA
jgi:hypothetical protein